MESLTGTGSATPSALAVAGTSAVRRHTFRGSPTSRVACLKAHESTSTLKLSRRWAGSRRALANEVSGAGRMDGGALWSQSNLICNGTNGGDTIEVSDVAAPLSLGSEITGSNAGLFRAPISGGVQSATSAHDLPRPALAVRNLMEQARFAHLCTVMSRMHHHRAGYPFGSLVDFATDSIGHPIFSLSPLAIHTRNLLADSRCTLVIQIPGWSGLSNARVTIFGDTIPLPPDQQEYVRKHHLSKHQQWASQQWGNFCYFRMHNISDIYFIGGFGTVCWLDVKEYEAIQPDKIVVDGGEQNLKELNAMFSKPLKEILSTEAEIDDAAFISIDSKGTDIRVRRGAQFNIQRLSFESESGVESLDEAKKALQRIIERGRRSIFITKS